MEKNATNEQMVKRQKTFPWLRSFLDKITRNFPDDCSEDLLDHLLENLKHEVKALTTRCNRKRLKRLFETVQDLFLHFWWRIRWKGEKMWKKYWKKDYTETFNFDIRTKCVVKLLYFMIYIGILLSKGSADSLWISQILQALKFLPDCDNIIYSSLLLIKNLKKKYHSSYCEILKNVLISTPTKFISEPVVYIKIMILFRNLKAKLKDQNEKRELLSAVSKFQAPPNLISWIGSFDLDVSKLKHKNIAQHLFKKSFKDLFQQLQTIVAEHEFLQTGKVSKRSKNRDENQESLLDMDSTLNFFHSPKDFEVLKDESVKIPASKNKRKLKKKNKLKGRSKLKNKNKVKSQPEKEGLGTAAILDKTRLVSFNKGEDKETVNSTPSSSMAVNTTVTNLDETDSVSFNSGKDNETEKFGFTSSSLMTVNRTASTLDGTHSVSFNNGDDNETNNLGLVPPSPANKNKTAVNLDNINSCNKSVHLDLYQSSPKPDTLLFNPAPQPNASDHQTPPFLKEKKDSLKINTIGGKKKKRRTLSKKLSLCKNGKTSSNAGCKKFKLFNTNLYECFIKSSEVQSKKKVLCDVNETAGSTPLSISTNANPNTVTMLQNSSKQETILSSDTVVLNRHSFPSICEKSCEEVVEDIAKEQVSSHVEDDEIVYNTPSQPIFDSMPDLSVDKNSFHENIDNSSQSNSNLNCPDTVKFLGTPLLYEDNYSSKDTGRSSTNEDYTVHDKTIYHIVNQTPVHLQNTSVINPDGQFFAVANNSDLCQNDCELTRHECLNSSNSSQVLEQLCNRFNSFTNLDSNSNSGPFAESECQKNDTRISFGSEANEHSENQNCNQTGNGNNTIKVCTNRLVFPQNHDICTTSDGNSGFVIDCSFVNATNQPQSENKSEIPSIKIVINLNNKKHGDNVHPSNENFASNSKLNAMSLVTNHSSNILNDNFNLSQRTSLPVTSLSQVMSQCDDNSCSHHQISNSHKEMPMHTTLQMESPLNLTTSTPIERQQRTSTQTHFKNPYNKVNDLSSPLQHVHSTSRRRTSMEGSDFYTPHTSDCESDAPVGGVHPRSPTSAVSSLQKRYIEKYVQSVSNSTQINLTPTLSRLQRDGIRPSSRKSSKQLQDSSGNGLRNSAISSTCPLPNGIYRDSVNDIYTDVSCDDISVSSMGVISEEETDHSLLRNSSGRSASESPLKKIGSSSCNNCRTRTISNSSMESCSIPVNNCHRSKKVSFGNLYSGKTNSNKETLNPKHETSRSTQTKIRKKKIAKPKTPCSYNLRSRRKIPLPIKMSDYVCSKT